MKISKPEQKLSEKTSQINVKIWEVLNDTLALIWSIISISSVEIRWLENIDKNKNYFFIANHPSYIDWFFIRNIFDNLGIWFSWIMHNSIMKSRFIWDYLREKWHIWVLNKRDSKYYEEKWYPFNEALKLEEKRVIESKDINQVAYKSSINCLESWKNLFMFVSWGWYEDLWKATKVYDWYKKIVSLYLQNNPSLDIVPVTFEFKEWFKKWGFPFRNNLIITFLKPILVNEENKDSIYNEMNLLLK